MKAYQKPAMLVLSISANDMLCNGCGKATRGDVQLSGTLDWICGTKSDDNIFTKEEAESVNAFAPSEMQFCTGIRVDWENYCKFTSTGTLQLFNS